MTIRAKRPSVKKMLAKQISIACVFGVGYALTSAATAGDTPQSFSIAEQPLARALMEFGAQSDRVIVAPTSLTVGKTARAVRGEMQPERALQMLLLESGLSFQRANDGSIVIVRAPAPKPQARAKNAPLRLAAAAPVPLERESERAPPLEEVVVTAGKRGEEKLQDLPVSITVIGQDLIERTGMDSFVDYARNVPGLGFQNISAAGGRDDIRGGRRLNLRGIESGFDGVPTVAYYIGDTPVPVMDPKLFDIERIEVLRGPQGTLYGANSMGGAIRLVMNKPEQNEVDYVGDVTFKTTHDGDESYNVNGMFNLPLVSDVIAVRGVVFKRDEGGFIDNVRNRHDSTTAVDVEPDINDEDSWGARIAVGIQPTEDLTITPSVFHQDTKIGDTAAYDSAFRDLAVLSQAFPERQSNDFTLSTLEISYSPGNWEFFSATGLFDSNFTSQEDLTAGYLNAGLIGEGQFVRNLQQIGNERFTQEVRLAYKGSRWNGVLGAFYMDEDRDFAQDYPNELGTDDPPIFNGTQTNNEKQTAVFGEVGVFVLPKLELIGGLRWFKGEQDQHTRWFYSGEPDFFDGKADDSALSPKAQVSYHIDDDKMVYVSATRGFRPGGPSTIVPPDLCAEDLAELGLTEGPTEFAADKLWSYEAGAKVSIADRALVNLAAYYIDWKDAQQTVLLDGDGCGFTFIGNVGAATSRGIEMELAFNVTDALLLNGSLGYTDAEYSVGNAGIGIEKGDRLPLVPEWTASASAQYSFTAPTGHEAYARIDGQYMDEVLNGFSSHTQGSYTMANFRLAVELNDHLELSFFVDNIFDERPQYYFFRNDEPGLLPDDLRESTITSAPRTFGLSARYRR